MGDERGGVTDAGMRPLDAATRERLRGMGGDELHAIISRAIDGRFRLCVPPRPDDDDLILAALIDEALASRAEIARLRAVEAAARAVTLFIREGAGGGIVYENEPGYPERVAAVRALHTALAAAPAREGG